jgi:hypothetical protein
MLFSSGVIHFLVSDSLTKVCCIFYFKMFQAKIRC